MAPDDAKGDEETASVGVLGWLGFVILNVAAWGIIAVSTTLQWWLGFALSLAYTVIVVVLAVLVIRWGQRFRPFQNLLWLLSCVFVCVLGVFLSVNVVCDAADECGQAGGVAVPVTPYRTDLRFLLPEGSDAALAEWARQLQEAKGEATSFAQYGGYVFFNGIDDSVRDASPFAEVLLRSDGSSTKAVTPTLQNARGYLALDGNTLFFANPVDGLVGLYSFSPSGAASGTATLLKALASAGSFPANRVAVSEPIVSGGKLYFKLMDLCDAGVVYTIFRSDGTAAGTVDLRGDARCPAAPTTTPKPVGDEFGFGQEKPTWTMLSAILLGIVPSMALAAVILAWKRLEGMFLPLYYGLAGIVVLIYLIATTDSHSVDDFLKWFLTMYTLAAKIAITVLTLLPIRVPAVVENMLDWVVFFAGVPFWVMIHVDLEIPVSNEGWKWAVYAVVMLAQMFAAVAVQRTLPMALGAGSAFVLSWKISRELVRAIFGHDDLKQGEVLTLLGFMALQGILIIVGAIAYAWKRKVVEEFLRGLLTRCWPRAKGAADGQRPTDLQPDRGGAA